MSAFNTVRAECRCTACGKIGIFDVQFKYGHTWQIRYAVGDVLKWGGNDVGVEDAKKVRVEAIGGPCSNCGADGLEFDVFLASNQIEKVEIVGEERPSVTELGFEIIE
jgi:hypothetical protein